MGIRRVVRVRGWSIRARLVLAAVAVLAPYLSLAVTAAMGLEALQNSVEALRRNALAKIDETAKLQVAVVQLVMPANDYLITGDPRERAAFDVRLSRTRDLLARADTIPFGDPEERRLLETVKGQVSRLEALGREILAVPDPVGNRAAAVTMKALDEAGDAAAATLERMHEIAYREVDQDVERGARMVRLAMAGGLVVVVLSLAAAIGLALALAAWLRRPIRAIAETARRMADGDLSRRVEVRAGAELGEAARAFNQMAERLEALQRALADRIGALEQALAHVKQLKGLVPVCAYCKKVRRDQGYWQQLESFVAEHTDAEFSHGICPGCLEAERAKRRGSRKERT